MIVLGRRILVLLWKVENEFNRINEWGRNKDFLAHLACARVHWALILGMSFV